MDPQSAEDTPNKKVAFLNSPGNTLLSQGFNVLAHHWATQVKVQGELQDLVGQIFVLLEIRKFLPIRNRRPQAFHNVILHRHADQIEFVGSGWETSRILRTCLQLPRLDHPPNDRSLSRIFLKVLDYVCKLLFVLFLGNNCSKLLSNLLTAATIDGNSHTPPFIANGRHWNKNRKAENNPKNLPSSVLNLLMSMVAVEEVFAQLRTKKWWWRYGDNDDGNYDDDDDDVDDDGDNRYDKQHEGYDDDDHHDDDDDDMFMLVVHMMLMSTTMRILTTTTNKMMIVRTMMIGMVLLALVMRPLNPCVILTSHGSIAWWWWW